MVLRYVGPRHPIHHLRRKMDRLFSGVLSNVGDVSWPLTGRGRPAVNVWETDDALKVELEVPGVKSDQVELSVAGDELSIRVDRPDVEEEGTAYHRRERPVGSFARVLRLPVPVDADRVEAEMRHGVLTISLPKAESARPRKIQVTPGG
ncbi:MAG TPA: Hsp20/alpha crystallin family protein [Thermoguttaceae bacterium]|nr:Hsp20/alpha crystallin family protein [Thermoguttaceae bacterium]